MFYTITAVAAEATKAAETTPTVSLPIGAVIFIAAVGVIIVGMLIGIAYWQTHKKQG